MAKAVFGKLNVVEDLSWSSWNMDFLVEVLSIRYTYRHPDENQILTITIAPPSFRLSEAADGKSEE